MAANIKMVLARGVLVLAIASPLTACTYPASGNGATAVLSAQDIADSKKTGPTSLPAKSPTPKGVPSSTPTPKGVPSSTPTPTPSYASNLGFGIHHLVDGEGALDSLTSGQFIIHADGCLAWIPKTEAKTQAPEFGVVVILDGRARGQYVVKRLANDDSLVGKPLTIGGSYGPVAANYRFDNETSCLQKSRQAVFVTNVP